MERAIDQAKASHCSALKMTTNRTKTTYYNEQLQSQGSDIGEDDELLQSQGSDIGEDDELLQSQGSDIGEDDELLQSQGLGIG